VTGFACSSKKRLRVERYFSAEPRGNTLFFWKLLKLESCKTLNVFKKREQLQSFLKRSPEEWFKPISPIS
jgi:hypothetical protein